MYLHWHGGHTRPQPLQPLAGSHACATCRWPQLTTAAENVAALLLHLRQPQQHLLLPIPQGIHTRDCACTAEPQMGTGAAGLTGPGGPHSPLSSPHTCRQPGTHLLPTTTPHVRACSRCTDMPKLMVRTHNGCSTTQQYEYKGCCSECPPT